MLPKRNFVSILLAFCAGYWFSLVSNGSLKPAVRTNVSSETQNVSSAKQRIFCMIPTTAERLNTKAIYVERAWAHQCDGHKFFTVIPEEFVKYNRELMDKLNRSEAVEFNSTMLPLYQPAGYGHEQPAYRLSRKVFLMMRDVYRHYGDYDWYLKADDDTLIFMDNLREFLVDKNSSGEFTYGYNFKVITKGGYHSGGGGYVLPNSALLDIGSFLDESLDECADSGIEDVDVARCLREIGYQSGSSLDEKGRERFHPFHPVDHFIGKVPDWLYNWSTNVVKKGLDCCSDKSISFHYVPPADMMLVSEMMKSSAQPLAFKDIALALKPFRKSANKTK